MPIKECIICNEDFVPIAKNGKICSDECRKIKKREYQQRWRDNNKEQTQAYRDRTKDRMKKWRKTNFVSQAKPAIKKICVICNEEFEVKGRGLAKRNTCTKECKQMCINTRQNKRRVEIASKQPKKYSKCIECSNTIEISIYNPKQKFCGMKCRRKRGYTPAAKMSRGLHSGIYRSIRKKVKGNIWTYFDFTIDEFREHFELLFTKVMKWENMGLWHIDHLRPKASFNQEQLADPTSEDFKKCWALENLQPLWAKDNLKKGAKEMKV